MLAIVVAAQDTSGSGSLLSKILAGLGALATFASLARDLVRDIWLRDNARDEVGVPRGRPSADAGEQTNGSSTARNADRLANAVTQSWSAEARIRRLHTPWLLPVRWQRADDNLASVPDVVYRSPTTGIILTEGDRGPAGGEVGDLVELYSRLPHRRLVVLGEPGSGKSVFGIELTLALLARRQPGGAVPIPLQLAFWDPGVDLKEWLVQQLIENYMLSSDERQSPQVVARDLVHEGVVLPVLDGLDEMPENLRLAAVRRLNHAPNDAQPLILTCRTDDYRATVRGGTVVSTSLAVELQPLAVETALRYLTEAARGGDTAAAWADVLDEVRSRPSDPLAVTLRSPLMLSMAREIYCDGPRSPRDLLEPGFDSPDAMERHLLSELVPASYQQQGQVQPPLVDWPEERPEVWLKYLAIRGSGFGNPNLAWWQLERGIAPVVTGLLPAAVAAAFVAFFLGSVPGLLFGFAALAFCVTWQARGWTLEAALVRWLGHRVRADGDPMRVQRTARWAALTVGRLVGAAAGVAYGYTIFRDQGLERAAAAAVLFGLAIGLAEGFVTISLRTTPTEMRLASYRGLTAFLRRFLIYLAMGAASTATVWVLFRKPYAMLVVAVTFIVFGLIDGINVWLDVPADVTRALSPRSTRQDERFASVARSVTVAVTLSGVTVALYWVASAVSEGIVPAVVVGAGYGLADRLMGLATSVWGRYLIAKTWAASRGDVPWRLMLFLEDAHRRGVVRRVGAIYQFRHARLQVHLAQSAPGDRS